jgi:LacI family transcriptional regulator
VSDTITLNHVAQIAGVSPSTVSRILNGSKPVNAEKRAAVEAAIAELGYRPSIIAQGLARGQSMTVGVITPSISSPYYGEIMFGIEEVLDETPFQAFFVSALYGSQREGQLMQNLIDRRVDGLIIVDGLTDPELLKEQARRLPLILLGRNIPGLADRCIRIDNLTGSRLAAKHLVELGHRRIAYIAGPIDHEDAQARLEGYRQILEETGIAFDPQLVVFGDYTEPSGVVALEALFARHAGFSAIIAANDQMAQGARLALYRRGVRVPDDLSIIGCDDLFGASYTTPPLTTVHIPAREMGHMAARGILSLLDDRPVVLEQVTPTLVVRESTAISRHFGSPL